VQALDVIEACLGQLRVAGLTVSGLDMSVALQFAAARGYDTGILADLLASASEGIFEGINAK
jgi:hypothetical protein